MAKGLVSDTNLTAIADAIRAKNGSSDTYTPATMATAISNIPTSQVDQTTALQWMLNNKTDYTGIAAGLTSLTELPTFTMPSGVTNFSSAFRGDSALTSASAINMSPESRTIYHVDYMFYGCSALTSAPIINEYAAMDNTSAELLGSSYMFYGCSALTNLSIHASFIATSVNMRCMFYGCTNLASINNYREGYPNLLNLAKINSAVSAFYGCKGLETISITGPIGASAGVSFDSAFSNCSALKSVLLYDTVNCSRIGRLDRCFASDSKLENFPVMNLSSNLVSASAAFNGCRKLTNTSLDNILASMLSATNLPTKTLKYIGLSSNQATTCTGLSNWAALSAAGWTTGY